jgi:hypothetical protein
MPLSGKRQFRKRQASSSSEEGNDGDKDDNADPLMPDLDAILKDTKGGFHDQADDERNMPWSLISPLRFRLSLYVLIY